MEKSKANTFFYIKYYSYPDPAFTKSHGNELWVLLLEKAWAKCSGSYAEIEAGTCREVLRVLTGAPTMSLITDEVDFWEEFTFLVKCQFIMTAVASR